MSQSVRIRELMTDPVVALQVGDTLAQAEETMRRTRVSHLPVTDGNERIVGLLTHGMLLAAWVGHGNPLRERHAEVARDVPVEMIMQREVLTTTPDAPASEAARMMEEQGIGCLPVVSDDGRVVGIVTETDFVHFARKYLEG